MGRKILAVFIGLLVGGGSIAAIETISSFLYPMPAELDPKDKSQFAEYVKSLPPQAFMIVLAAHAVGSFLGGFICLLAVQKPWKLGAAIIGCVFMLGGVANMAAIPSPFWFAIVDLLLYLPGAFAGGQLAIELGGLRSKAIANDANIQLETESPAADE